MKKALVSFLVLTLLIVPSYFVKADDVADLRAQIDARNANIKALEAEIAKYQQEADKTSAQAKTLANAIKVLQATGKKLDTDIKLTQAKISAANLTIQQLSGDISEKEARIDSSKKSIGESLRLLNQADAIPLVQNFLQRKNLGDMWNDLANVFNLQSNLKDHIASLNGTKKELEGDKNETEEKKNELKEFADTLTDQKKVVALNTTQQNNLLKDTKSQEAAYQQLVKDTAAKKAALEKEVFDYESKIKYILDPSSLPASGSAPFSWPTTDVYITQLFGKTSASGRLYASGSHNGVDFKALMGTQVHALANGVVTGTGDTDLSCPRASFGRWVLIKYDNGLSAIFGHLSVIKVSEGQRVNRGDVVALSGNTGYSTGAHLHVSVYPANGVTVQDRPSISCAGKILHMPIAAVNAYLDPMLYFPKL